MKTLRAIKLINWHYFVNETIRISGSTLLTGDNGVGKSTILDALQYALVADTRRVRFNVAAHEETKRTLDGYLRGRTGTDTSEGEGQGALRSGDFTTYIVLEFYDTRKRQHFLLGCGVDHYASGQNESRFFKIEEQVLDDSLFGEGDRQRSARELKALLQRRQGATVYATAESYRADVLTKMGHLSGRFFDLLVKAIGFVPITDIRRFVYDYLLEARAVTIDAMRENLLQYRQYEQLAVQTEEKLAFLTQIRAHHEEKVRVGRSIAVQAYVVLRAEREEAAGELATREAERVRLEGERETGRRRQQELDVEERRLGHRRDDLRNALSGNEVWRLVETLRREGGELAEQERGLLTRAEDLADSAQREAQKLAEALRLVTGHAEALGLEAVPQARAYREVLQAAQDVWAPLLSGDWETPAAADQLAVLTGTLAALEEAVGQRRFALAHERRRIEQEITALQQDLERLLRKQLVYPENVLRLRDRVGVATGTEPRVLCEVLEIPDETWQDAVEGYLNTQRFDLLVPPEHFDAALAEYERRKRQDGIHGVGLINTGRVREFAGTLRPGSLAEEVRTDNLYARAYVDRLLGRVMKAATEQELKQHELAITPSCMTYRNHTARQISFHVYENWYIGQRAFVRQRQRKEARLGELTAARTALTEAERLCAAFLQSGDHRAYDRLLVQWQDVNVLPGIRRNLDSVRRRLEEVDITEIAALEREVIATEAALQQVRKEQKELTVRLARSEERLDGLSKDLEEGRRLLQEKEDALAAFTAGLPVEAEEGAVRYAEESRKRDNRSIAEGFRSNQATLRSRAERLGKELLEMRVKYNSRYQFGGAADPEDNDAYDAEERKLSGSELPAYRERIRVAQTAAEQEFKEHFIYKLREQITGAQTEMRTLNAILREIDFGRDRYQFQWGANREFKPFYDMLMDELALEGFSLFSSSFLEKYRPVLDDLFTRILEVPEAEQARNIELFTDYRTYMDFDIRIENTSTGETASFARVCREKSGGETQTPFYVAMLGSFLQLYRPRQNEDSVRLVLFDEAFNRMDPDRVETTMELIRRLGVQVIAAAPTDKCEILAPYMETVLLMMREGHRAWVDDYHQVLAAGTWEEGALPATEAAREVAAAQDAESGNRIFPVAATPASESAADPSNRAGDDR